MSILRQVPIDRRGNWAVVRSGLALFAAHQLDQIFEGIRLFPASQFMIYRETS